MKELSLKLAASKKPEYLRIADAVRAAFHDGRIAPGESLPSTRELAADLGCHRHTVMSALEELVAEGWLVAQQRKSYSASQTLPTGFFEPGRPSGRPLARRRHQWRLARSPQLEPLASGRYPFKHNFVVGPDLRLFPFDEFKTHLNDSLRRSGARLFDYGDPFGQPALIAELNTYLRRMHAIKERRIIVTHGSQEAIYLAAQLLLRPGDEVAVESLGYKPAFAALRAAGARLVPISTDAEGINCDELKRACSRGRLRLIYITPLHQYPTTVTLTVSRRLRLYELASRHGVPILEDDYDHEFHYRCQPLPPMASDDPGQLIIYVSTFSKVFSPSARIGFMAVPEALAKPLSNLRRIITRQNDYLMQDAVARWMRSGGFERHLRRTRRVYEERRDALIECLETGRRGGLPLSWIPPDGGMAVWLNIGADARKAAKLADQEGIYVSHEGEHQLIRGPSRHLRLGFANQTPEEIRPGMEKILAVLRR